MNYIYDILLNFNNVLYDFYDWNLNDNIIHIRRIPIMRIDKNNFKNIKNNKIKINSSILEKIKNKTEIFTNRNLKNIEYACLFCSENSTIAIKFDSYGKSISKSSLLVDEESEVCDSFYNEDISNFSYEVLSKDNIDLFKTRKEKEIYLYILKELKKTNKEKLKYLYFECFKKQENDCKKILNKIIEELNNNFNDIYKTIYNFFKLTSINNH